MQDDMLRIYVIGPVNTVRPGSECDQFLNVRRMIEVATDLVNLGMNPILPALCSFWHMMAPQPRAFWIAKGQSDARSCNAAFRMDGESSGADADQVYCEKHEIPIFNNLERLVGHFGNRQVDRAIAEGVAEYQSDIVVPATVSTNEVAPMHPSPAECRECKGTGRLRQGVPLSSGATSVTVACPACKGTGAPS